LQQLKQQIEKQQHTQQHGWYSVGQVQQTPQRDGGSRDRQRLDDEDGGGSVNPVKTVGIRTCQRHDVHQSAPHQ